MFEHDDVLRSLRRYVSQALGSPPWRVRTERVEVKDDERPAALIEVSAPTVTLSARASVPQGNVLEATSYAVACYPEKGESVAEARRIAAGVASRLRGMVQFGLVTDEGALGAPSRFPIYDYDDVPVTGTAAERAGPDVPYDYGYIMEGWNVRTTADDLDLQLYTVMLNLRVRVDWPGRVAWPTPPTVEQMPGTGTVH